MDGRGGSNWLGHLFVSDVWKGGGGGLIYMEGQGGRIACMEGGGAGRIVVNGGG